MKVKDVVSNTEFLEVVNIVSKDEIHVKNLDNDTKFAIRGVELINVLKSADDYTKTKKITKTELAEKLTHCYNVAFKVCFEKATGEERVLRGRLLSHETLMGRSYVEDLDVPKTEHRLRQVDHRTLKWLIVDGVRYESKK